jgi:molecular chaperone GrpE
MAPKEADAMLAEAISQRDEYLDMAQRLKAEFENFKRRNQSVRAEAWEDGARETIALMLPVIDNLERALSASKEKTPLRDGLELILRQMIELLEKRGVTVIDRLGLPFEPTLENAVMQADPSEGEPGTVCTVLQKGYQTASRVIRYAMVRVVPNE